MFKDPLIEEIHKYREEHAAKFNYDIHKIVEYYMERQKQNDKKIVNLIKQTEDSTLKML